MNQVVVGGLLGGVQGLRLLAPAGGPRLPLLRCAATKKHFLYLKLTCAKTVANVRPLTSDLTADASLTLRPLAALDLPEVITNVHSSLRYHDTGESHYDDLC